MNFIISFVFININSYLEMQYILLRRINKISNFENEFIFHLL